MEKRKFPRQGLGVEAIYVINGDSGNSGVIHDFSQDGLFITYGDESQFAELRERAIPMGASVDILLPDSDRQVTVPTELVHFNESGVGLTFVGNKFRSYQIMVQARQRSNAVVDATTRQFVEGHRINDENRRIKILNACNGHLKDFMDEMLNEYLNSIEDALLREADRQKSDAAQHAYFDAMAHFKRQRKALPGNVTGKIISDAQDIVHGRYKAPASALNTASNDQSLSLIEKGDFEEWLIVRVVVSRAELQLRDPLIEVQLRMDAAFGKDDGKRLLNPYSPALITQAFHASIHGFRLTQAVERLVFKIFQEVVLNSLTRLYKNLNAEFVKNGVLPDIDITRYLAAEAMKKHKSASPADAKAEAAEIPATGNAKGIEGAVTTATAPARQGATPSGATSASPAPATPHSYQALQEGLARARNAYSAASSLMKLHRNLDTQKPGEVRHATTQAHSEQPQPVPEQAIRTLNSVQQQLLQDDISLNEPGSLVRYMMQLSEVEGGSLSEQDVESAEMVETLFSNIVDHQRIVADLKPELRKLEVPILKVLLQDPRLFSSDYHPARQFVNYVALLSDKESVNINVNRPTILDSIRFVLASPVEGNEPFIEGLSRLDKVVEREKKIIERNLARVTEACEGQQRIQMANNRVERELAERLQGKAIPRAMHELLSGGWKDLMRLCYLREGVESRAWEMTLVVVDQLIVRMVGSEYDESRILFKAEELQKLIEKGLSKVPDNKGRNADILARIHELLIDGGGQVTSDSIEYQPTERKSPAVPTEPGTDTTEDKSLQRWINRARKLKEGQWLEFDALSSTSHLYQLAWMAEHQARFVFVNHHGMKVADLPLEEVAAKLKTGDVVVLSDAVLPAVENGLDSLVQKIYDQLAYESAHDQLTGMKTRKEFERCLAQSVARAKQASQRYALVYLDIMQFKVVNNTCGYEAGDNLLREIGSRFRSVINNDMVAGRIGSNEFGVIAPVDSEQQGFHLATELKSAIEEKRFVTNNQSFVIEAVASLLHFDQNNDQVLELLRSAESAVAIAKKSGHKEIQIIKPGDSRIEERDEVMAWVARINRALDMNTLKLRCQKISPVASDSPALPHYEILLTVVDDKGVHLPPADFIRAAEEYSRMSAVDRWVIDTVLRWMTENRSILAGIGGFSINLSGHSMNDDSFLDFMFENLVRYGVPRDKLIFEVTETTAVANLEDAADFINEMRGIGCRFSLDDFGAGQSSYAYLKRLPVDFIKIDGAFIKNIASDDVDYALVKSITEMGHFLNKKIIAEYVSDQEIMEVVKDIGVDYVQGYYLGKPKFIEELCHPV